MSFNKIVVIGNLGRDPELRYTPQGTPVGSVARIILGNGKLLSDFHHAAIWKRFKTNFACPVES